MITWLDAFSSRFLTPELAPRIYRLSQEYFSTEISSLFAYMGIEYCFEYSLPLNELRVWNDHIFGGFQSCAPILKNVIFKQIVRMADAISGNDNINKALRYGIYKAFKKSYGVPHLIPASYLDHFPASPMDNFQKDSVFDILRKNEVKVLRKEPKFNFSESSLIRKIPLFLKDYDVLLFKLNSLDRLGHEHGPTSVEVRSRVTYLDELLGEMTEQIDENTVYILLADHGMCPIYSEFDITKFLRERGFEFCKHYICYVGSTYVSFWFSNSDVKGKILEALIEVEQGRLLSSTDRKVLGLDSLGKEYGEEIFVANQHIAFFPEFYHVRKPPKGMHGYAFNTYDNPVFIMKGGPAKKIVPSKINFVDISPTLLDLLDIQVPNYMKGHILG